MARANPFELPDDVIDAVTARLGDLPAAGREQALLELTARFPAHAEQLRNLVRAIGDADRVLGATFPQPLAEPPQFEGYRVVRRLGEGAFGVVYLAEQQAPIQRAVAIKLLRPGAGDRSTLARFDAERRFLARLQHPSIAQIFDAGALPDGRPWIVMEHVDGVPIAAFCDRDRLPVEARLRLFVRVCQAVQHAHEQGIVHRDLKPSNVLVVEIDGEPRPKVIDFGIARALQASTDSGTPRTETGRVVGTPGYMSPEQAEGRLHEVDVRSDVWSLGAMLFELLTGTLPLGARPTSTDTDPVRPSHRLAADPARSTEIAGRRGTDARRLAASLRGDLDWIVCRALARDRDRRHPSAHELAADVLRHLRGEPVHAGPPSFAYRLRKFSRRHRTGVAVAASAAVLLAIGSFVFVGLQARAASYSEQAEAAVQVLLGRANDPELIRSPNGAPTRRALAEDALAFYARWSQERPRDAAAVSGRASCLSTLSQVHWLLGNSAQSEQMARQATAAFEELLANAPDDGVLLRRAGLAYWRLGRALVDHGVAASSGPMVQRAVALLERAHAQHVADAGSLLVDALHMLGTCGPEPLVALARAEAVQRQLCAADPEDPSHLEKLGELLAIRACEELQAGNARAAASCLQQAEALDAQRAFDFGARHHLRFSQAICAAQNEPTAAVAKAQRFVDFALAWRAAEPNRTAAHASAATSLRLLASVQQQAGLAWHETAQQAVATAAAAVEAFPSHPGSRFAYVQAVLPFCYEGLMTGRRADLQAPLELARRACVLLAPSADLPEPRRSLEAWEIEGLLGMLAEGVDAADCDSLWAACGRSLLLVFGDGSPAQVPPFAIDLGNRITRRLLAVDRLPAVHEWLDRLATWQRRTGSDQPFAFPAALQTVRLRAVAAIRSCDWTKAEACVDELVAANSGWRGAVCAAETMSLLSTAATAAKVERAPAMQDRAVDLCESASAVLVPLLAAEPEDPWLQEPAVRLRLRRVLLAADGGAPIDAAELAAAVADYEALGSIVPADVWDGDLLAAGRRWLTR